MDKVVVVATKSDSIKASEVVSNLRSEAKLLCSKAGIEHDSYVKVSSCTVASGDRWSCLSAAAMLRPATSLDFA